MVRASSASSHSCQWQQLAIRRSDHHLVKLTGGHAMSTSEASDTPGLITRPPYFLLAALVLAALLDWGTGLSFLAAPGLGSLQSWIGLAVTGAAIALAISGVRTFKRANTNVDPFQPALNLVTAGPYRFTR